MAHEHEVRADELQVRGLQADPGLVGWGMRHLEKALSQYTVAESVTKPAPERRDAGQEEEAQEEDDVF